MFSLDHSICFSLHDAADPGPSICVLQPLFVSNQDSLVPKAAVPGWLAPVQVGGRRSHLQVLLLLLPDQQGCVAIPQPRKGLRHGLLCQREATRSRMTRETRGTMGSKSLLYSRWITVRHVTPEIWQRSRSRVAPIAVDHLRSRSTSVMSEHLQTQPGRLVHKQNLMEQNQVSLNWIQTSCSDKQSFCLPDVQFIIDVAMTPFHPVKPGLITCCCLKGFRHSVANFSSCSSSDRSPPPPPPPPPRVPVGFCTCTSY